MAISTSSIAIFILLVCLQFPDTRALESKPICFLFIQLKQ